MSLTYVNETDPAVAGAITAELARQRGTIELIASENLTSLSVMEAMGSFHTNKYAEGYPGKRYYGGCEQMDVVENLARERVAKLFNAQYANVQPHSGAQANQAAMQSMMKPGEKVLGMSLDAGGHLSHGAKFNLSGKFYQSDFYGIDEKTERLDMDAVRAKALEFKPQVIIAGASAYPRTIDFAAFADIAHEVGALLLVDMAHIAGLVAGGAHPSPVPYADVVTSTSHKTLRGPRGGFMVTNNEERYIAYNKAVFPGCQGGPLMHIIAAKAVAFGEALEPSFADYAKQTVVNAKAMGEAMVEGGLRLVSGGTDNHLCLVDLSASGVTGLEAEDLLESVGLTVNKNAIPNDPRPTTITSGIRVGSPAMTTRGFSEDDARTVGTCIARALFNRDDERVLAEVRDTTTALLDAHPLYPEYDA